jgi:hypothetical protein
MIYLCVPVCKLNMWKMYVFITCMHAGESTSVSVERPGYLVRPEE